jgi:dipeptidyl aminopeptidase/acylaminoacyl peptidase
LAYSEANGFNPEVFIYNIGRIDECLERSKYKHKNQLFNPKLESTLKGVNKYGIHMIKFSPDGKYIIIVGNEHDRAILVYDWKTTKLYSVNRNNRAGLDVEIINY